MGAENRNFDAGPPKAIHVIQGGYSATADPDHILTTILGSCVSTCLCDPVAGVGGINHFLLPDGDRRNAGQMRYGLHAMELLINELLKLGARKDRMRAKLFGGARMYDGLGNIGQSNAEFALRFLETEGIILDGQSLGGNRARRLRYWPTNGKAQQLFLNRDLAAEDDINPEEIQAAYEAVTFF